jgi:nitrogen regulatory protein PII
MKSVFIIYNQALGDIVMKMLDYLKISGFTMWEDVKGRGTHTGEPHFGTHTWPAMNSAVLAVVENQQVKPLLEAVEKLNEKAEQQGIRAFVWAVEQSV